MRQALLVGGHADRYVARLYAASYLTAFLLIVGLFLILDLSTNLDEYVKPAADGSSPPGTLVLRYYLLHVPFLYLQVAPFVALVAGLFSVSRLLKDNELVAALGAGVSAQRVLAPILCGGLLLAAGMFTLRQWAAERLSFERDLVRDALVERRAAPEYENVWLKDRAGSTVRLGRLRLGGGGEAAEVGDLWALVSSGGTWISLRAERARWDARAELWRLEGGQREVVSSFEQRTEPLPSLTEVRFTPYDAWLAQRGRDAPLDLSFGQARDLAERDPDNKNFQTLLHYHLTFPLANLVLLLVGLPFLLRFERSRGLEGVVVGFLLCLFYYGADFVCRSLGMEGQLSPLLACWLPLLFFGSLGVVLYGSARS
ncbi:MAG: YjgP/YjgQ family permease [Planctomycetes bacterium]|nr:YjgP/YjgQ family permease [Planctomycetota bacterium]